MNRVWPKTNLAGILLFFVFLTAAVSGNYYAIVHKQQAVSYEKIQEELQKTVAGIAGFYNMHGALANADWRSAARSTLPEEVYLVGLTTKREWQRTDPVTLRKRGFSFAIWGIKKVGLLGRSLGASPMLYNGGDTAYGVVGVPGGKVPLDAANTYAYRSDSWILGRPVVARLGPAPLPWKEGYLPTRYTSQQLGGAIGHLSVGMPWRNSDAFYWSWVPSEIEKHYFENLGGYLYLAVIYDDDTGNCYIPFIKTKDGKIFTNKNVADYVKGQRGIISFRLCPPFLEENQYDTHDNNLLATLDRVEKETAGSRVALVVPPSPSCDLAYKAPTREAVAKGASPLSFETSEDSCTPFKTALFEVEKKNGALTVTLTLDGKTYFGLLNERRAGQPSPTVRPSARTTPNTATNDN